MDKETKEQIIEVLMSLYQVPGQYFIAGIISLGIGKSMLKFTNWGLILIIFGIICFVLEIISPIFTGIKLYKKAIENIKRIFR